MAKIIELIYCEDRRGLGKENDPVRLVPQLWTKDGRLVAEKDGSKDVESVFIAENLPLNGI